jgi:hypothetical protein
MSGTRDKRSSNTHSKSRYFRSLGSQALYRHKIEQFSKLLIKSVVSILGSLPQEPHQRVLILIPWIFMSLKTASSTALSDGLSASVITKEAVDAPPVNLSFTHFVDFMNRKPLVLFNSTRPDTRSKPVTDQLPFLALNKICRIQSTASSLERNGKSNSRILSPFTRSLRSAI